MVLPIIWAGAALVGLAGTAWTVKETGDAAEKFAVLAKWGAIAGGVYVSFAALKSAGVLK